MPWSGPDISIAVYDAMTGKSSTTVQNQLTTCSNMTVIGVAGKFISSSFLIYRVI